MRLCVVAVLAGLLVAGCSSAPPGPSPTAAQGSARIESYLAKVLTIGGDGITFTKDPANSTNDPSSCDRFYNGQPTGQVEAQVQYTAKPGPAANVTAFFNAAGKVWADLGLKVTPATSSYSQVSADDSDGYAVYASYYPAVHTVDLGGHSPCLWAKGTSPAPTTP